MNSSKEEKKIPEIYYNDGILVQITKEFTKKFNQHMVYRQFCQMMVDGTSK